MLLAHPNRYPRDLAKAVHSELKRRKTSPPPLRTIVSLMESMYFASMMTEESQPISFHVVYLDPINSEPKMLDEPSRDIWTCITLSRRITVTPDNLPNLAKLAYASDPRTSSFAVWHDSKGVFVWGLVDQGNRYHEYVNFEADSAYERPGLFQASIVGIGHLVAYIGLEKVAELVVNEISRKASDVLWGGPVHKKLKVGLDSYMDAVKRSLPSEIIRDYPSLSWEGGRDPLKRLPAIRKAIAEEVLLEDNTADGVADFWLSSLCRLLLRVQNYHHGGALLITPDRSLASLNIKYKVRYKRLRSALETHARLRLQHSHNFRELLLSEDESVVPRDLWSEQLSLDDDLSNSRSELDGTIWFISLLTRVDGLVLMNPFLEVLGFGVEIKESREPDSVFVATDPTGRRLKEDDFNHYGTRHRSMMRYCSSVPGSVGFVASQDGGIRVITKIGERVVIWKNVQLQLHYFIRPTRRTGRGPTV